MVRNDRPSKIYFDLEYWSVEEDITHTKLFMFLDHIRKRLGDSPAPPEICFVIGTRPDKGLYKNSYHVVVDNFVCRNNHDEGSMLELVTETFELGEEWTTVKPNGKTVYIVDNSVYKTGQCIRLPLSAKHSSKIQRPFHILSEDGYDQEETREPEDSCDIYSAEHFYISNPDYNGDRIMFQTPLIKAPQKNKKPKKTRSKKPKQETQADQVPPELPMQTEDYPSKLMTVRGNFPLVQSSHSSPSRNRNQHQSGYRRPTTLLNLSPSE